MKIIRVLIVDDSPFRCDALETMFSTDPDIHVVGKAFNGREAVELTKKLHPQIDHNFANCLNGNAHSPRLWRGGVTHPGGIRG